MSRVSNVRVMGSFSWETRTDRWCWDPGMYELHGYPPGAVVVSASLVLAHKSDADRARAESIMAAACLGDSSFSNYHRIVDVRGRHRTVLVVGASRADAARRTAPGQSVSGFMVDVTEDERSSADDAVERARRGSAPIQQSLGLLMGTLGMDEAAAFALLVRVCSHHNVKLRDLAQRFMAAATSHGTEGRRDLAEVLLGHARSLAVERAGASARSVAAGTGASGPVATVGTSRRGPALDCTERSLR